MPPHLYGTQKAKSMVIILIWHNTLRKTTAQGIKTLARTVYHVSGLFTAHYTDGLWRRTEKRGRVKSWSKEAFLLVYCFPQPRNYLGKSSICEGVKVHEALVYTFSQAFSFMAFASIVINSLFVYSALIFLIHCIRYTRTAAVSALVGMPSSYLACYSIDWYEVS